MVGPCISPPMSLADQIREHAVELHGHSSDFDGVLETVGDARLVLLGEASHGTAEFYRARAAITRRLIEEKGFTSVAVEADWPDAYRANRYVQGEGKDGSPEAALRGFRRFPQWMWRNTVMVDFLAWLREFNASSHHPVGFYGLDLYSLYTSIEAVLEYLQVADPDAAREARERYSCFEHVPHREGQHYGRMVDLGLSRSCEQETLKQLMDIRRRAVELLSRDGTAAEDELFYAEQNARLVHNAEEYYRTMFGGRVSSWNLRDCHMADTLDALIAHRRQQEKDSRVIVWEHNSHIGDARATYMGRMGEYNVGQLVRERHPDEAVLIGFTTFEGTVTAANNWDEPAQRMQVRQGMEGSFERLFHEVGLPAFWLDLDQARHLLEEERLERAIGVIYRPATERQSHYFDASLPDQFDGVVHIDRTSALMPLETSPAWPSDEPPETFPSGW